MGRLHYSSKLRTSCITVIFTELYETQQSSFFSCSLLYTSIISSDSVVLLQVVSVLNKANISAELAIKLTQVSQKMMVIISAKVLTDEPKRFSTLRLPSSSKHWLIEYINLARMKLKNSSDYFPLFRIIKS